MSNNGKKELSEPHLNAACTTMFWKGSGSRTYGGLSPKRIHSILWTSLLIWVGILPLASAVLLSFDNCLSQSYIDSSPRRLQFDPLNVSAIFDTTGTTRRLNLTIYGNVTGQAFQGEYPLPTDPRWQDPNDTFGKIIDIDPSTQIATTLKSRFSVLSFTAYQAPDSRFCESIIGQSSCPLIPAFNATANDLERLPAFTVGMPFSSSYEFATLAATIRVVSGGTNADSWACISTNITPDLGDGIKNALTFVPVTILIIVAIATIFAAIFSPWGTSDIFRWTSNYGRDEDLLRLVTPGFGDCLQYIQFIVLTGSLSLNYPGFYQPVVSNGAWSILSFNQSLVSQGDGYKSLEDGLYHVNASYGLSRMRQYIGASEDDDLWASMAVVLLGIIMAVVVVCQLGFLLRWGSRAFGNVREGDLRNKNVPFTVGNVLRILFNFFILPAVALSMFQLAIAPRARASIVAPAVILLAIILGLGIWAIRPIFATRPRAQLFDDLPTVLLYGPLYNTFSDGAAPFALVPVLLSFVRGVAIGAVQASGIAQLVILAICEVIFILTLHAFRPFPGPTSMNAYHTLFSLSRLCTVLLSVAFVPTLGVTEAPKGWVGYAILVIHALILVFGFFLNALQTILEVAARLAGAGGEARGGLATVFGKRQLSKRGHRRNQRSSMNSQAAMLVASPGGRSPQLDGRTRSLSASSAILLGQSGRASSGFDQFSQGGDLSTQGRGSPGPGTPGGATSPFPNGTASMTASTRRPTFGSRTVDVNDPYYRPPRLRRGTLDLMSPDGPTGEIVPDPANGPYKDTLEHHGPGEVGYDMGENQGSTISPAYLRVQREDSDTNLAARLQTTDYAVRESDFYYGISRGPALSHQPTRRLKTGPADPTGPVASATGWLKGLFGTGRKEKGKGFEVVRSTRAPPQMLPLEEVTSPTTNEPYRDNPDDSVARGLGMTGAGAEFNATGSGIGYKDDVTDHDARSKAPALAPIEGVGAFDVPSGWAAQGSTAGNGAEDVPNIPRKSSRRSPSADAAFLAQASKLDVDTSLAAADGDDNHLHPTPTGAPPSIRLPFESTEPSPSPERGLSAASSTDRPVSPIEPLNEPPQLLRSAMERPVSTGYVQQHVASDSIRPAFYRLNSHLGDSAELVDETARRSLSTGGRSTQDNGDNR